MVQFKKLNLILLIAIAISSTLATEPYTLESILHFLGGGKDLTSRANKTNVSQMTYAELGLSRGKCSYNFLDLIRNRFEHECAPDDFYIAHLLPKRSFAVAPKLPIMVKCLPLVEVSAGNDSLTGHVNKLQIIKSVKDVVDLLKPVGNTTKRNEAGSCVLIFFYTESSIFSSLVAPYANRLPHLFPSIRVAAIDAYQFTSFNTEFGVVGLPTLLLFHQGRPILKFYSDAGTYSNFITRHTGIQPAELTDEEIIGPLPMLPVEKVDYYLVLAWGFILLCLGNYFAKSAMCQQIVEMIKRNWRESEAQMEPN